MNNWHQVWSNKTAKVDETAELLPQLIKLNDLIPDLVQ